MRPNGLYSSINSDATLTTLLGGPGRILESQSVDARPKDDGYFLTLSFSETLMSSVSAISKGPRTLEVNVHHPMDIDRDYAKIDKIINRIDVIYLGMENFSGSDNVRITKIRRIGRSGNDVDEGWRTITRQATYGVLYDEYAG